MGKPLIILSFLVTVAVSLYLFFSIELAPTPDAVLNNENTQKLPLIELENFTYFNYDRHIALESFSGNYGFFIEPNILQSIGNNELRRFSSGKEEIMKSKIFTFYFKEKGLTGILKKPVLEKTELEGDVSLIESDKILKTPRATFEVLKNRVHSNAQVELNIKNHKLEGYKGFNYDLTKKYLEIFGPIKGTSLE